MRSPEGILSVHWDLATCYRLVIMGRDLSRQEPGVLSTELMAARSYIPCKVSAPDLPVFKDRSDSRTSQIISLDPLLESSAESRSTGPF
jgi:hypothetical protein